MGAILSAMIDESFRLLGVGRDSSPEEIKSAYRREAKKHHPDVHGGNEFHSKMFAQIASAYAEICNSATGHAGGMSKVKRNLTREEFDRESETLGMFF